MSILGAVVDGILAAVSQRAFWTETQIREFVRDDNDRKMEKRRLPADKSRLDIRLNDLRALRIFVTDQQQTWLVADSSGVYCVLDDRRLEKPGIRWRNKLETVLPVTPYALPSPADEKWSATVGALHFGNWMKELFYSKDLFPGEAADVVITRFLLGRDR
jgi:hypothetical protein